MCENVKIHYDGILQHFLPRITSLRNGVNQPKNLRGSQVLSLITRTTPPSPKRKKLSLQRLNAKL
jgi:hypothetical protein